MTLLTPDEYNKINELIRGFHLKYLLGVVGPSYISETEKRLIVKLFGKEALKLSTLPLIDQVYLMGKLTAKLGDSNISNVSYTDFNTYISKEQFDNETINENKLDKFKKQTYLDVLNAQLKVQNDIRQFVITEENNLEDTGEEITKKNIERISKRVINDIPSWSEKIDISIKYNFQSAFEQGKADKYEEEFGSDTLVYKLPLSGACKFCISAYLTNGVGSEPRIFNIGTLTANGSNIGRKNYDWLPVLGAMHPRCRCTLHTLPPNQEWSKEQKRFVPKKVEGNKVERKSKVKVYVGSRVFEV